MERFMEFGLGEDENSAEGIYKKWATEHHHIFKDINADDLYDMEAFENKLEYQEAYNNY